MFNVNKQQRPAFTLIELLLVMGIMAILATVVIVAINPTKQLGQANDVANESKVRALSNALEQYYVEQGTWPNGISESPQTICSSGGAGNCLSLDDALTSTLTNARSFIGEIPQAVGFTAPDSGFAVYVQDSAIQVGIKTTAEVSPLTAQIGRAYNFDGSSDYVIAPATINDDLNASNITLSSWVYSPTLGMNQSFITEEFAGDNRVRFTLGPFTNGKFGAGFYDGSWHQVHADGILNEWTHVVGTYDGSTIRLYVNGSEVATHSYTGVMSGTEAWRIGRRWDAGNYHDGKLFDARIYNKTLTPSEIEHVYNFGDSGTDPGTANLVAQYKMDDTNAALAYDSSGNFNHGSKEQIDTSTFHYEGGDVPYSFQNGVGYSSGLAFDANGSGTDYDDSLTWIGETGFSGNFSVDWVLNDVAAGGVIGFENDTVPVASTNYNNQPYNVQLTPTGIITRKDGVAESVSGLTNFDGDIVTFARNGTDVTVAINGTVHKTWTGDAGDTLYPATSLANASTLHSSVFLSNYSANYAGANVVTTDEFIPRDERNTSFDVLGNPLQYGAFIASGGASGTPRADEPLRAYNFDGIDDYVETAITDLSGSIAVSGWFSSNTPPTVDYRLFSSRNGTNGVDFYVLPTGRLQFYNGLTTTSPVVFDFDGSWQHIALVINGASSAFYYNGVQVGSSFNTTIVSSTVPMQIGRYGPSSIRHFNGKVFDARLYSSNLSSSEIDYIYSFGTSGTNPTTTNLVAHYKMDDTNSTVAYDSSGNENHGTKTNITPATFHYKGVDVPYSWQNTVGFSEEIVKNNDFQNGLDDWNVGSASVSNGVVSFTALGSIGATGSNWNLYQNGVFYDDEEDYEVTFEARQVSGAGNFQLSDSYFAATSGFQAVITNSFVEYTTTINPTNGSLDSLVMGGSTLGDVFEVRNVSVKGISRIPRNESNTSEDVLGNPLQYSGPSS